MRKFILRHKPYFKNIRFLLSVFFAIAILIGSLVVNFYAGVYATNIASNSVTDLILSNIPVFDVHTIFVQGSLIFWIFIALLCLSELKRIPFTFKTLSLFILVRSLFIILTHIGPFPTALTIKSTILENISFEADLFFSGHTGLPFLMALVFWRNIYIRLFCIASAILFGVIVLLGHLHYSIDVLSAFFITYGIFKIAEYLFPKDQKMFFDGLPEKKIF